MGNGKDTLLSLSCLRFHGQANGRYILAVNIYDHKRGCEEHELLFLFQETFGHDRRLDSLINRAGANRLDICTPMTTIGSGNGAGNQ